MKRSIIISIFCSSILFAQNQGVGIGTLNPDASARLDIVSTDKGILIPRVNLIATSNPLPVNSPAVSLLVYNQATINDVVPGFYYWDGTKWVNLSSGGSNDAWLLNGNIGTNSNNHFVGTTDAQSLTFRTNNTARFRIANGNQVFGLNGGSANAPFYSWENDANSGLYNPATDELGLSTNGTERIRINNNGNVGINTTPSNSAILDINANNRGVRIPNVALVARNNNSPIGAGIVNSLLVYNTATAGTGTNAVSPGYYYWNGTEWVRLIDNVTNDWTLLGNAGTDPSINFIGTTDNQDFVTRTNNTEKMRVTAGGNVGIGTANPQRLLHLSGNNNFGHIQPGTALLRMENTENTTCPGNDKLWDFRVGNCGQFGIITTDNNSNPNFNLLKANNLSSASAGPVVSFNTSAPTNSLFLDASGNLGVGTSAPNSSAILELNSTNKGFLATRVALTAANNPAPVASPATGLIVYNTATSGTYPNDVSPGYYYWNGSRWIKSVSQNISLWYYPPTNINALTRYSITGTLPGITSNDAVFVNLVGDWGAVPGVVIEHVEARTNEIRFVVYNRTTTNYTGMDFRIAVIKP